MPNSQNEFIVERNKWVESMLNTTSRGLKTLIAQLDSARRELCMSHKDMQQSNVDILSVETVREPSSKVSSGYPEETSAVPGLCLTN